MLYLYSGTDRKKTRAAMNVALQKIAKKGTPIARVTDANTLADLQAVLQGAGMFEESRVVVLNDILLNEGMRTHLLDALPWLKKSTENFFILEEKPDAATRKQIEKYAESSNRFDCPSKKKDDTIFVLANALRRKDRKSLWVAYQRELAKDSAPEAIHGVLFWAAKDICMKPRAGEPQGRAKKLVEVLAELPHEARRRGEELEYALERFVLSGM